MTERINFPLLPYSYVVGQDTLRWLLEIDYVMRSSVAGVLVSGERGTAKSTIVRAFAMMMYDMPPVTLPINATDDRVVGGWNVESLTEGIANWKPGLLEQAHKAGMLYIDEVNLLDDHVINLILDVASTNVLVVEREGQDIQTKVSFRLVGTMNPEEGALRPQLLDRFGLFVPMAAERAPDVRSDILRTVLRFDVERDNEHSQWLARGKAQDAQRKGVIERARRDATSMRAPDRVTDLCARVAAAFEVVGHRGEIVMAQGACAAAALDGRSTPEPGDVRRIAPYAVMHRRHEAVYADAIEWSDKDNEQLVEVIAGARRS